MAKEIFPALPEDMGKLTEDELNDLIREREDVLGKVTDRDADTLGDLSMKAVLDQTRAGVEDIKKLKAELETRGKAEEEFDAQLKALRDEVGIPEPSDEEKATDEVQAEADQAVEEPEPEPTPEPVAEAEPVAEVEEVAEPEPVAASLERPARRKLPAPEKKHDPIIVVSEPAGAALVAASGIPNIEAGLALDRMTLAEAVGEKSRQGSSTARGVQEKVLVARANYGDRFPEDRKLYNDAADTSKIQGVVSEDALVASGGLCAPVTPYYELQNVSTADRPVRDALAGFNAVRGGINAAAPPTLSQVTGVGIITAANDALGGTFATKECQVVDCPPFEECTVSMVYRCLQFGNLNARAFPEMIATWNDLVIAAHARTAETALLDGIAAASTAVTTSQYYGSVADLIYGISRAAAGFRSRHRMPISARLHVILPAWILDESATDVASSQFQRFEVTRENVEALLERYGVNVTWTLDGETGGGQVFGAQTVGALLDFPDDVIWYIYPEGSFLFLDGGTLDLGIVRDSTLNSTNDFQIFAETFEAPCFVGVESLKVTSRLCPTGEVAAPLTGFTCAS